MESTGGLRGFYAFPASPTGKEVRMNTSQFDSNPEQVDHWTPESSWCAGCWRWTVDCEHLLDPLPVPHHAVKDACSRALLTIVQLSVWKSDTSGIRFTNTARYPYRLHVKSGRPAP